MSEPPARGVAACDSETCMTFLPLVYAAVTDRGRDAGPGARCRGPSRGEQPHPRQRQADRRDADVPRRHRRLATTGSPHTDQRTTVQRVIRAVNGLQPAKQRIMCPMIMILGPILTVVFKAGRPLGSGLGSSAGAGTNRHAGRLGFESVLPDPLDGTWRADTADRQQLRAADGRADRHADQLAVRRRPAQARWVTESGSDVVWAHETPACPDRRALPDRCGHRSRRALRPIRGCRRTRPRRGATRVR